MNLYNTGGQRERGEEGMKGVKRQEGNSIYKLKNREGGTERVYGVKGMLVTSLKGYFIFIRHHLKHTQIHT